MDMEYDLNEYFVLLMCMCFCGSNIWSDIHIVLYQAIIGEPGEPASIEIAPCMTLVQECNASASHLQLLLRH